MVELPFKTTVIQPLFLPISNSKTTNLIFPYAIKGVDRGSDQVLVQKAKGTENILQVKADTGDFKETNLTIITADGKLHSFILSYAENPIWLNIEVIKDASRAQKAVLHELVMNRAVYDQNIDSVLLEKPFLHKGRSQYKINFSLSGIYLKDSVLFFALSAENLSLFDLSIENIQFIVKDRKGSKRSAVYEKLISPLYELGLSILNANEKRNLVIGFSPFTFFPSQVLYIKLHEKNGGRSVILPIKLKTLLRAKAVS